MTVGEGLVEGVPCGAAKPSSGPAREHPRAGPRQQSDLLKLWVGQSVSEVGSQVTEVALPLTAVVSLHVSAGQLGLVNMARWAPFLLFALIIGAYADRSRRRRLLVAADIGRAVVLAGIVAAAAVGVLDVWLLIGLVFVFGSLTVLFEVTYNAYVPSLVANDQLVSANSRLQASASVAQVGGPALGGLLVQLVTAPVALLADATSFLMSVTGLLLIRGREPVRAAADAGENLAARIRHGLRITYRNPFLRALVGVAACYNFFDEWILTLFLLYAVHDLGLGAGGIGLIFAVGAVGATIGSILTGPASRRLGLGRALLASVALESVVLLALPLTPAHHMLTMPVVAAAFALNGFGVALSSVAAVSIRQSVTPDHLLGRMTASYRSISYGAVPLGAAIGGLVGELVGLHAGLVIGALGMTTTVAVVVFSPLPGLRTVQDAEHAAALLATPNKSATDAEPTARVRHS